MLRMTVKIFVFLLLSFMTTSIWAQKGDYRCYAGPLFNPEVKDITQVRLGLGNEHQYASFIIFYKNKYSADIFCPENHLGHCTIEDDSGSFEILTFNNQNVTIQFNGRPKLTPRNNETIPEVDAKATLKSPIRMRLTIRPKSDCRY